MKNLEYKIVIIACICLLAFIHGHAQQYQPANVPVDNSVNAQNEPAINIDPNNSNHLMSTYNDEVNGTYSQPGFATSTNGGSTWAVNYIGQTTNDLKFGWDPSCAIDNSGNLLYCYDASNYDQNIIPNGPDSSAVFVAKFYNNQWTYNRVTPLKGLPDKPYMAYDKSSGNTYVSWTDFSNGSAIKFVSSTNEGVTFSSTIFLAAIGNYVLPKVALYPQEWPGVGPGVSGEFVQGSVPAVAPDGDVYVVWLHAQGNQTGDNGEIDFARLTNGGTNVSSTGNISGTFKIAYNSSAGSFRLSSIPTIAIDQNNKIYVAFVENDATGSLKIYYTYSTDYGAHWAAPQSVTNIIAQDYQYFPWLSVSPLGTVSLVYYEGNSTSADVYLTELYPGATSFSTPFRITTSSITLSSGWSTDYIGLATKVGNEVYPVWSNINSSTNLDIFTTLYNSTTKLAYSNQSLNNNATAQNNGRHLVEDGSGNYHQVFASGGEVYYRKNIGGTSWQTPIRLSDGNGSNNYPAIAVTGSYVYATWQKYLGSNNYNIYFAASTDGGSTWSNYVLSTASLSSDPLPAIQAYSYIMVVFNSGNGIKSYWTYYQNPGPNYWVTNTTGFTTAYSPTLTTAIGGTTNYFSLAFANSSDNQIYYYYYDPTIENWTGGPDNLSSIVPGTAVHLSPSITFVPGTSQLHIAWQMITNGGASVYDYIIIHRISTDYNNWPNQYYTTYYEAQGM